MTGDRAPTETAALSFARDVRALLTEGCERCHRAGGQAGDTEFILGGTADVDRGSTLPFVDVDRPGDSRLLSKGAGIGHSGGAVFAVGTAEYQTILTWITQGAMP